MKSKRLSAVTNDIQNKDKVWQHILDLIQQLFDMRLVENLARPIQKQKKQQLLSKFRQKMNLLHFTLRQVQRQGSKSYDTSTTKDRNVSKAALQSRYYERRKDRIKLVQMMYSQLFFQGSFRFYHKVALAFGFPLNLQAIDIQQWAKNSQMYEQQQEKCCCQQGGCCCQEGGCCCCCHD